MEEKKEESVKCLGFEKSYEPHKKFPLTLLEFAEHRGWRPEKISMILAVYFSDVNAHNSHRIDNRVSFIKIDKAIEYSDFSLAELFDALEALNSSWLVYHFDLLPHGEFVVLKVEWWDGRKSMVPKLFIIDEVEKLSLAKNLNKQKDK
ncbi:MAG: hypothetical protein Kapaf2KO_22720 [Candidatus Kapaibacteriales bacterium]